MFRGLKWLLVDLKANIRSLCKRLVNRILGLANLRLIDTRAFGRDPLYDIQQLLKEPKVLFDVGANVGQTVDAWRREFKGAAIHSFEPVSYLFEQLEARYGQVAICNNLAVGRENMESEIHYGKHEVSHSLVHDKGIRGSEKVRVVSLDTYCEQRNIDRVELLKIDVEGYEPHVIDGARHLLKEQKIDLLLIELGFDQDGYYVYYPSIANKLGEYGYSTLGFYNQACEWDGSARLLFCNVLFAREGLRFK